MPNDRQLVRKAQTLLASSRAAARRAKNRIRVSRERLSQTGDTVVSTASAVSAARSAIGKT